MQVPRETSYEDLQKLMLKEMSQVVSDRVLESSQGADIFRARVAEAHAPKDRAYLNPEVSAIRCGLDALGARGIDNNTIGESQYGESKSGMISKSFVARWDGPAKHGNSMLSTCR